MDIVKAKYLESDIAIFPEKSIDETAEIISDALSIQLKRNDSGKFEEFIGYEDQVLGMDIHLISDPSDSNSNYDLVIHGSSNSSGIAVDITEYILHILRTKTKLNCFEM